MVTKKGNPAARVFAVKGDVGGGDEVALHDVLTWPKQSDAEAFCAGGASVISRRVVLAERGASFEGGMTMTIGEEGVWTMTLENDRLVTPLQAGQVMSVLGSDWVRIRGTLRWQVSATVIGHIRVTPEGARYVPHEQP